jgi:hypothetical protein
MQHYFNVNYVWDNSLRHLFKLGPDAVFGGWTISGTLYYRTRAAVHGHSTPTRAAAWPASATAPLPPPSR